MKTITFAAALAAATALTAPAMAAGSDTGKQAAGASQQTEMQGSGSQASGNLTQQQTEANTQAGSQSGAGQETAGMSGERLDEQEVRELQQALKDAGHDIEVDGQWGDGTAQALHDFQEQEGLTASGELDDETLTALGLDLGTGVGAGGTQAAESPVADPGEEPIPMEKPDEATQPQDGTSAN